MTENVTDKIAGTKKSLATKVVKMNHSTGSVLKAYNLIHIQVGIFILLHT